jgi:hypothetical protein
MKEQPNWYFEAVGPMGGATGNAYANTLQGAGRTPEEELARESIQNSCDAVQEGCSKVRVAYRIISLEGEQRDRFLEILRLREGIGNRIDDLKVPRTNCLTDDRKKLKLAYIEDYGTVGLYGNPHTPQSNFYRLLLSLGDSTKAAASGTGGSYGYGKAALSMNSRLRTIVAYSCFDPVRDGRGVSAHFMGCSYFDSHKYQGQDWTGRAWFAVPAPHAKQPIYSPIQDDSAHDFAAQLGFKPRAVGEYGTSILVIDCAIDYKKLINGIEEWWWPRLLENELDVEVEVDGQTYYAQPKRRPDLAPFIECYTMAVGRSQTLGPHQKTGTLNRLEGVNLGSYGFHLLQTDQSDVPEEKLGCVALIRSPKMVVEYAPLARSLPPAVGVFIASTEIDDNLKLSEPPTHDRWDRDSQRLQTAKPNEESAREIVEAVLQRIKALVRRFQSQATPQKPASERRLRMLERMLGSLIRPPMRGVSPVEAESVPVEIRFTIEPHAQENGSGMLTTQASVRIGLQEDADEVSIEAIVRVRVPVLEDDEGTEGEFLPVSIETPDFDVPQPGQVEPEFEVTLSKRHPLSFSLRSDPYDRSWSTKVDIDIRSVE